MAPLRGVVIKTGAILVIQLSSGANIEAETDKDFRLGDPIWILFDYTQAKVAGVWTEAERYYDGDPGQPSEGLWPYPGFEPDNIRPPTDPTL